MIATEILAVEATVIFMEAEALGLTAMATIKIRAAATKSSVAAAIVAVAPAAAGCKDCGR